MANPYQAIPNDSPYPAYNPAYPQPPPYQAAPVYPPSYAPAYQAPPYQPAPGYSASAPIVVNVTNTQNQQQAAPAPVIAQRTVFLGRNYDSDTGPALIIFIVGWFCCFVWAAGFRYIRSKNMTARALGIASVICFFLAIAAIVIAVVVSVELANEAVNQINNNHGSYSTTYTFTMSQFSMGYKSIVVPYQYTTVSISSYGATWQATSMGYNTDASGYSGTTCGSNCPMPYENLMSLVAKCDTSTPMYIGNSYYGWDVTSCNAIYLGYNDYWANSHSGSIKVTVTFSN